MKKTSLISLSLIVLVLVLAGAMSDAAGANPGVVSGTITGWPQAGPLFIFDDHVSVTSDIEAWWSTALVAVPSGWFYGFNASTEIALAPGITAICQVTDASQYTYDPWDVGPVYSDNFVLFHNTVTGYYAAFRVDSIYGTFPDYIADVTWYLQEDGSANFGPCAANIDVTPAALASTQSPSAVVTQTLTISNTGDLALDWQITEELPAADCSAPADIPWASVDPASGTTAIGGASPVEVTFDSAGLAFGTYTANLCLTSNDPDPGPGNGTDLVVVPLELTVAGVVSGTVTGWLDSGPLFLFDDHVSVTSDIEGWWSVAHEIPPVTGWFYGYNASTDVARAPGITAVCQVADASTYSYEPWAVGPVPAGEIVLFRNTVTGYYAAFRVDDLYGTFPNNMADITWYLQENGSANFGPCIANVNVSPLALSSTQSWNTVVTQTLTISNTGDLVLDWQIAEELPAADCSAPADIPWASVDPASGTTAIGGASPVDVTFDSTNLNAGTYTGNLCLTSNDPDPGPGNGTDLVIVPLALTVEAAPAIDLAKTVGLDPAVCATGSSLNILGRTDVYYCYEVTNTGNITLTLHDLVDSELGPLVSAFTFDLGPGVSIDTVAAGLEISATITQTTVNTATWTAYNPGPIDTAEATATATVTDTAAPAIDLVKTVGLDPAACATSNSLTAVGSADVYYCYQVTNTGNITLTLHDLVDTELGDLAAAFPYDLAPGASYDTVTAGLEISATITQTTVNTATWTAYNPGPINGAEASASATVTVDYQVFLPVVVVSAASARAAADRPEASLPATIPLLAGGFLISRLLFRRRH